MQNGAGTPNGRPSVTNEADYITNESNSHTKGREKKRTNLITLGNNMLTSLLG